MKPTILTLSAALASVATFSASQAHADVIESVRLGAMAHNIEVIDPKNANKESGTNINGEIRFETPKFLEIFFSPHPYIMASVNSDGNTSYGGVGLQWDLKLGDTWQIESGFGYVLHDGELEVPFGPADPRRVPFLENNVLFGSRDLFRSSLALTKQFDEHWGVQVIYEHLSHGQILGNGRNQGLDELGVRVVYNFD